MNELIIQYQDLLSIIEEYNNKESKDIEDYQYIIDRKNEFITDYIGGYLYKIFSSKKYGIQIGLYTVDALLYNFDIYYVKNNIKEMDFKTKELVLIEDNISNFDNKMVDNIELMKEKFPELFNTLYYIRFYLIDSILEYKGISLNSIYLKYMGQ